VMLSMLRARSQVCLLFIYLLIIRLFSSEPKAPTKLDGKAEKDGELTLEWRPPVHPNGEITHYRVSIMDYYLK
jgi:hypothetical protein